MKTEGNTAMDDITSATNNDATTRSNITSGRQTNSKKRSASFPINNLIMALVVIASLAVAGYFYKQNRDIKANPNSVSQKEVESLTKNISKLMTVPTDEQPTVATVQDKEKLKDQPFFKDAQNGDKLLIYTKAQKAIIYRESQKKLVNVGPVSLENSTPATETTGTTPTPTQ
jgi:hypothetical protein